MPIPHRHGCSSIMFLVGVTCPIFFLKSGDKHNIMVTSSSCNICVMSRSVLTRKVHQSVWVCVWNLCRLLRILLLICFILFIFFFIQSPILCKHTHLWILGRCFFHFAAKKYFSALIVLMFYNRVVFFFLFGIRPCCVIRSQYIFISFCTLIDHFVYGNRFEVVCINWFSHGELNIPYCIHCHGWKDLPLFSNCWHYWPINNGWHDITSCTGSFAFGDAILHFEILRR